MKSGQHVPARWPTDWPRRLNPPVESSFSGDRTLSASVRALVDELETQAYASNVIVAAGFGNATTSNLDDIGAAVYFTRYGKPYVLACDRYDCVQHNVWAICMHVKALRGQERWGVGSTEQALAGYAALPGEVGDPPPPEPETNETNERRTRPPRGRTTPRSWRTVLGFGPRSAPSVDEIAAAHRKLAKQHHPDLENGDNEVMRSINVARDEALAYLGKT